MKIKTDLEYLDNLALDLELDGQEFMADDIRTASNDIKKLLDEVYRLKKVIGSTIKR